MDAPADQPSPEFRLVCAACQWPRERRDPAVRAAAADGLDWKRVAAIAERQRVGGLVADALRSADIDLPPNFDRALRNEAQLIARHNLAAAAETARLGRLFDAAGIDWLTFKGLAVAMRAYGTLAIKTAKDVDLLVSGEDCMRACALLAEDGYVRGIPGADISDEQLGAWMQIASESAWRHPRLGVSIDLHSRLLANPTLLPQAVLSAPRSHVTIAPGISVPTIDDALLYPYLFVHGARDGWFRLKWLADVAALLSHEGPDGPEVRYREARKLGIGRCAAQALLLAHELLALPLAPEFVRELRRDPKHRVLVRVAKAVMAGKYEAVEHLGAQRAMIPVRAASLLLRRGIGYKWREIQSLATNPIDRAKGRLPKGLGFLYPVLGGVRWSGRMLGLAGREQ